MDAPRNFKIMDVEMNWVKLATPVDTPFGTKQYEMQIATEDKKVAAEWTANHLNVKEKDGKFTVSLKRKATRADGSENGPVRVVDPGLNPVANVNQIGNGSRGNVIVWQAPYDAYGRKGVSSSLTAVQVTKLEIYDGSANLGFDVVETEEPAQNPEQLF